MKKFSGWAKFLIIMILIYTVWFFVDSESIKYSLLSTYKVFEEIFPVLILVFIIIFISNIFLTPGVIKKHLWEDSWIKWWFYIFIVSFILMAPPYVILPILWELRKFSMKYSLIAFLLNNSNVKIAFLPVMIYYFWLEFSLIISILVIVFAFVNSIIIGKILNK